jgi:hypothetical protein
LLSRSLALIQLNLLFNWGAVGGRFFCFVWCISVSLCVCCFWRVWKRHFAPFLCISIFLLMKWHVVLLHSSRKNYRKVPISYTFSSYGKTHIQLANVLLL